MKKFLLTLVGLICSLGMWAASSVSDLSQISSDSYYVFETITTNGTVKPTASTLYFDSKLFMGGAYTVAANKGSSTFGDDAAYLNCLRLKYATDYVAIKLQYPSTITTYGDNASRGLQVGSAAGKSEYGSSNGQVLSFKVTTATTVYISGLGSDYYVAGFTVTLLQPTISAQPASSAIYAPNATADALSLTAAAINNGTLSYQWYQNTSASTTGATAISGATSASYTPSTTTPGVTYYYCVVSETGLGKSTTSDFSCVTVADESAPTVSISADPASISYGVSSTITASISSNPAYTAIHWYKPTTATANPASDTELTDEENKESITVSPTEESYYYCTVTNTQGTTTSNVATVTYTKNTEAELTNLILSNGFNTAIVGQTVTGYYLSSDGAPTIKSATVSDGASYNLDGTILTVTAEDGTTQRNILIV